MARIIARVVTIAILIVMGIIIFGRITEGCSGLIP